ncbi:hypothetical protein WG68_13855 [Arsukibacterium ikkense]|uniref:DUF2798 domain-containing protein n=1 Tax=Arsukibacterium ikkense TaxID=336831 RepID=A0A0M2V3B3_9GAMM|nr:DUF2798 domain-containing protein [Arsukibacterium ikkense]KKO44904.1 hypothetical protein WG68_13855 [Arsukibacterium ikkense]
MFPAKFQAVIFAFIMSGFMAFLMSGILTFINLGWFDGFIAGWLRAYLYAHACAFPLVFVFAPLSRRITVRLINARDISGS